MLENEEFTGAYVKLPMGFFERIAVAAENHHQRLSQWVDTTTMDNTIAAISSWLDSLEQARTRPYPSAEPGDLLVKLRRAEFWTFTAAGWRELGPIDIVDQAYDPTMEPGGEKVASPEEVAAAHRRSDHADAQTKPRRFFGRSIVEDELDRLRAKPDLDVIAEAMHEDGRRIAEAFTLASRIREAIDAADPEAAEAGELVVVLVEKGSIEAGEFPNWIKPMYVKPGTISCPVIIKHPQI